MLWGEVVYGKQEQLANPIKIIERKGVGMGFDDIPEDREQSFPCECGGKIVKNNDGKWECDTCDKVIGS